MRKLIFAIFIIAIVLSVTNMKPFKHTNANATYAAEDKSGEWFPFSIPWNDSSDNVINVGKTLLEAPAGKHGFLTVKEGHFFFEDGTRIRFWGTNLSGGANFPSHEDAEKLAAHIAKYGFNIIRLHHMDSNYTPNGIFDKSGKDTQTLSEQQLDRLDYLIYQLKIRGVYVDINLHVGRKFTEKDGVIAAALLPRNSKQATMFDRKLIKLQKEYAEKLLTHYNPYTGSTYNNEPCVALVETTNENTLFTAWTSGALFGKMDEALPPHYMEELDFMFNQWLLNKYNSQKELLAAWNTGEVKNGPNLVSNPGFEKPLESNWEKEIHSGVKAVFSLDTTDKYSENAFVRIDIEAPGKETYDLQFKQLGINLEKGKNYTLTFKAKADRPRELPVSFGMEKSPWTNYGLSEKVVLEDHWDKFIISFVANADTGKETRLSFALGKFPGKVWLDDIELHQTGSKGLEQGESLEKGNIARTQWKNRFSYTDRRVCDNTEFYYSLERDYFKEMLSYIHNDLNIRVPVSTSNNYYGQPDLMAQNEGDYIDTHGYWDHPSFPEKLFDKNNFKQRNLSFVKSNDFIYNPGSAYNASPVIRFTMSAVNEKPLVISEWNHVFPNDYDYEESGILTAYSLFQDWDGLFIYTLSHRQSGWDSDYIENWFEVINNPGKMVQMSSCATAFIRGDFKPAKNKLLLSYSAKDVFNRFKDDAGRLDYNLSGNLPLSSAYMYMVRKAGFSSEETSVPEKLLNKETARVISEKASFSSDTGELLWDTSEKGKEFVSFVSDKFAGAAGFISYKEVKLGNLKLDLKTDSSVFLSSMDGKALTKSGHMLLTLVARQKNSGQEKDDKNGLKSWGKAPVYMEPVSGTVKIALDNPASKFSVYPLDANGSRLDAKKIEAGDSNIGFTVGTNRTPWYEIVVE